MFRVYFAKLRKNDIKRTQLVSRPLRIFPKGISQVEYAIYNSYEVHYYPQKN